MDMISLWYFSEVVKDMHITKTADRLYISQQTLSNHIQRLEDYYGTKLLYRKPSLSLTYAGEQVLTFAHVIIKEETNLKDILSDIENQKRGVLRIGASIARANVCLPPVLVEFSKSYPEVEIRFTDGISSKLEPLVVAGELEFAIVLGREFNQKLISKRLLKDQIYLCVANELLHKVYGDKTEAIKERSINGAHIQDFAQLPFAMMTNRMGYRIRDCFEKAGLTPHVILSSTNSQMFMSACCNGHLACFMNQMSLVDAKNEYPQKMNIFPLLSDDQLMTHDLALIRHKDRYLSQHANYFLDLLFHFFEELEQIRLSRKA